MKKFLKSLLVVSFIFGCSDPTSPAIDDTVSTDPFDTISVEPLGTVSVEPLSTLSVELTTDQETVTFDPYNTVSFVEPLDTVSLWPLGTDEQESDTGSETEEEVNCHNHYHCHWYSCDGNNYCHRHYHCQGHH